MTTERIVIVGGPRTGKSTLAQHLRWCHGIGTHLVAVFCGDPRSKVKEPLADVVYLPEGLAMEDESTRWIVMNWFAKPGPWICEGWVMARALRKWLTIKDEIEDYYGGGLKMNPQPCDRIIVFENQRDDCVLKPGQVSMHLGVMKVWREVAEHFEAITEYR